MTKRKKIPTKAELLQLQKLYKTDERIGERLGGVPPYLVAYWRRKKNIPKYSLPKFSESEVRNLWERYGDDEKSGLELGISKAAFYNWRRRYGIKEKPAFLKLEQLELNFPGSRLPAQASSLYGQRSMVQKILARVADADKVEVGEEIEFEPDLVTCSGDSVKVIDLFKESGTEYVWNPNKIVLTLNNGCDNNGSGGASGNRIVREFARRQGIKMFYDVGEGFCHQLVVEKGLVRPGQFALGTSEQMSSFGCVSAMATPIDDTVMAGLWATGKHTITVPETIRITVSGRRYRGAYATDIALSIIQQLGEEAATGKVIEYAGSTISQMTIGERLALSSLSCATGALAAICTYDATTRRFLTGRTMTRYQPVLPDKDAEYKDLYQTNIEQLVPQIASWGNGRKIRPVAELEETAVQQVILGSATAGRFEDLRVAAEILKAKQVHQDCRLIILPGSRRVYLEALKKGLIRVFLEAGAIVMHPGVCLEQLLGGRFVANDERCLTTVGLPATGTNQTGGPECYMVSPATAAASALNGVITDPTRFVR